MHHLISDYIEENNAIVSDLIMPAYTRLASDLTALLGRGRNSLGLYYAAKGCDYYELLTQKYTGSDKSVDDLFEEIADARRENLDKGFRRNRDTHCWWHCLFPRNEEQ